jgi:hypothetical protein
MTYDGLRLLAWPFHIRPFFDARRLGAVAACVLALLVIVAQPVASLAWLGGAHTTPEQAALHEAAVEHGHAHHHGASAHHAHDAPQGDAETSARYPVSALGPEFTSAAPHAGPFQDLLQTLLQAMLAVLPDAPPPGEAPRGASLVEDLPSQHSPPVPHRPPILLLSDPAIL